MEFIQVIKPKLARRGLLFIAAAAWTFAGGILLFKGITLLCQFSNFLWPKILISLGGGGLFYWFLFSKISFRHAWRIIDLKTDSPCLFSFFNFRSYIIMAAMITSGLLLRKSGIISPGFLSVLYATMGIPLFLSAFRFYYYGIYYYPVIRKMNLK